MTQEKKSKPDFTNLYSDQSSGSRYFQSVTLYEFTFRITQALDCSPDETETFYALIMGGIENALKVSRLIIKDRTGDGAAPFDFELINLSKVESVPLFGPNSVNRFQERTVEKVSAGLLKEFKSAEGFEKSLVGRDFFVTFTRRVLATQNRT